MAQIDARDLPGYIHVVKSYAGDSYWRTSFESHGDSDRDYYIKQYGKEEYEKLISGKQTDLDIIEWNKRKGDYFYDSSGTRYEVV